ncbi:MAG: 16S rRNA (cytosine(967)-C(5))-methyltransferase RsmB [Solirubrobacterales bacterium]
MTIKKQAVRKTARSISLDILEQVLQGGAYANLALDKALNRSGLSAADRALTTELVNGVVRMSKHLDWVLQLFLARKGKPLHSRVRLVLLLGIYQILFLERIPVYAAINESVELVRRDQPGAAGLVNGLLRNVERGKNSLAYPDRNQDLTAYFSVYYSHPEWMVRRWLDRWGPELTEKLLQFNNSPAPLSIRANRLKTDRNALLERLEAEGVTAVSGTLSPDCLVLKGLPGPITGLASYQEGLYYIQGEATMLIAPALRPAPGDQVYDLCAGVGGKSTHLAELMDNRGAVRAVDLYEHKTRLLEENLKRLGITIVTGVAADLLTLDPGGKPADSVLLDAPCSGLGVLRRRADLRWRKTPEAIAEMANLQRTMLEQAARLVRQGGSLLYATCSLEPEENEAVTNAFLASNPDFEPANLAERLSADLDETFGTIARERGQLTVFPPVFGADGMYLALMRRR